MLNMHGPMIFENVLTCNLETVYVKGVEYVNMWINKYVVMWKS